MDPDEQSVAYHRGFAAGQEHSKPSQETERRLKALEDATRASELFHNDLRVLMGTLKEIPQAVKDLTKAVQELQLSQASAKPYTNIVADGVKGLIAGAIGAAVAMFMK